MTVEIRECSVCEWDYGLMTEEELLRCAHFDGKSVVLIRDDEGNLYVQRSPDEEDLDEDIDTVLHFFDNGDYDAALAAFNEAAERLVQGD